MDALRMIAANRVDHEWLTDAFAEESRTLAEGEVASRHHFIPVFYLRRWAIDGLVKAVDVDTGRAKRPLPPKSLAFERDLYTLPDDDETTDLPLRWVETHLSRIEDTCSRHIEDLVEGDTGLVVDDAAKADLAVFLGLQISRTVDARRRTLAIVNTPDSVKRRFLPAIAPTATAAQISHSMNDQLPDPKHEAIRVMLADVRNVTASTLLKRLWTMYETQAPLVTCDEPVVAIAGPPRPRNAFIASGYSAVIAYPLSPNRVLVMFHPDLQPPSPFTLDTSETEALNQEIVASSAKTAFERPVDEIIENSAVPPRPPYEEPDYTNLDDSETIRLLLASATPRNRWIPAENPPTWPVDRWYTRPSI
ncbi:DUF4238 domain-containing protein [Gordonia tangerina]|uniref:DUF4238 domain-containing protein n=1 Tax=Gordonia tangerina TaxID=2911060 RepID=A0ABS9DK12_9ACTN|nr:DUF4238 domain-containing protein [Gordonia tangerina]MCF3939565.1 DUF4238 domain-containing protein [Gordonia tangerina]